MAIYKLGDLVEKCETIKDKAKDRLYIDLSSIKTNDYKKITANEYPSRAKWKIDGKAILIGRVRPKNRSHGLINKNDFAASSGFAAFTSKTELISIKYLWYILNSEEFIGYTINNSKGSTYPEISNRDLFNFRVEIPTIKEQQKLIDIIEQNEKLFLNFSNCVRIDNYENAKSDMNELIDIIEPLDKLENKVKNLENKLINLFKNLYIISDKESVRIKEIASVTIGGTPSTKNKGYWEGTQPWLNSGKLTNALIPFSADKFISSDAMKKTKVSSKGDIIMSIMEPQANKVSISDEEYAVNQSTAIIKSDYSLYFELVSIMPWFNIIKSGSAQQSINKTDIENTEISFSGNKNKLFENVITTTQKLSRRIVEMKTSLLKLLIK